MEMKREVEYLLSEEERRSIESSMDPPIEVFSFPPMKWDASYSKILDTAYWEKRKLLDAQHRARLGAWKPKRRFLPIFGKPEVIGIYECEVLRVSPQPLTLHTGEMLYRISSPQKFKDELYYSMFFKDSIEECRKYMEECIRFEAQRSQKKKGSSFSEEEVLAQVTAIKVYTL